MTPRKTHGNRHLMSQVSNRELSYGKFNFSQTAHDTRFFPTPIPPTATMSSLLIVASRVQAAVKAYCSAKEHADWAQWKGQFVKEKVRKSYYLGALCQALWVSSPFLISPIRLLRFAKRRQSTLIRKRLICIRCWRHWQSCLTTMKISL